jgi:hypothetical protein
LVEERTKARVPELIPVLARALPGVIRPAARNSGGTGHDGRMARFASYDGTQIGYRALGAGPPLVCLPGGPGRTSEYLGDLGGLSRSRQLIMPDTRGTGESADASDPLSYRCDRLAGDVEPLRAHLRLTAWTC